MSHALLAPSAGESTIDVARASDQAPLGMAALMMLATLTPPADANWFLAATAQVSATFVAIIGGFLISRTVAAKTERRTLSVQQHALEAQVAVLRGERVSLEEQLFRDDWVPWLGEVAYGIAASRGEASVEDALAAEPSALTADELRPVFEKASEVVRSALDRFEDWFEPDSMPPPDLEEIVDLDDIDDLHRISYWAAYIFLTNEAVKPSKFLIIPFSAPDPDEKAPDIVLDDRRARREKEDRVSELRTNERLLNEHARQLETEGSMPPVAAGNAAALVLMYLALGGVVWPLWLMSRARVGLSTATAWFTLGLVVSGLAAVLFYVVLALRGVGDRDRHQ